MGWVSFVPRAILSVQLGKLPSIMDPYPPLHATHLARELGNKQVECRLKVSSDELVYQGLLGLPFMPTRRLSVFRRSDLIFLFATAIH